MEEDISIASIAVNTTLILAAALLLIRRLRRSKRRVWVREILCKRRQEGAHHLLIPQLMSDGQHYKKFFRLSKQDYGYILDKVSPIIARKDSNLRQSITPSERRSENRVKDRVKDASLPSDRLEMPLFAGNLLYLLI